MLQTLNIILLVLLLITALGACMIRNLIAAIIMLSAFSLIMGLMWVMLRAPDLALAEVAAIGVVSTILFMVTIFKTEKRER